ncbi:MAG: tRNA (adenosine(37)-N6)-threonylcarbamoyltransferase complex dimerization subunit type 1 TsaB [Deltaproteobacteria bacterium]|nr:tRNA (adenosine(37)-N6)-threonylcarbamoyltransferase complex dimerization subunit type 1 TsaB [Deltaproteobacteria bacterium]
MMILGIDTSTSCGSLGLIDGDQVVAEYNLNREETHSARLIPSIQVLLKGAKLDIKDVDGLAVSLGPGSFTGLRVGLSTVKGLALAAEKPVVGVPTLDALAHNLPFTPYLICPFLDARRGEVYTALYKDEGGGRVKRLTPYQVLSPSIMLEEIPPKETIFLGDGVRVYGELIKERLGERAFFAPPHLRFLRGTMVAELGLQRIMEGERDDISSLVPIYVRPSDAEIRWVKRKGLNNFKGNRI